MQIFRRWFFLFIWYHCKWFVLSNMIWWIENKVHVVILLLCSQTIFHDILLIIQIIYMDDLSSRCFVGILTPSPQIKTRNIKRCDSSLSCSDSSQCGGQISSSDSAEDSHEETNHDYEAFETLPTGRVLRLSDDHLCRMIFGPKLRSSWKLQKNSCRL